MKLRDLRYLCVLADTRHFGQAAEQCFVSQPTLSGQLKKLEAALGVQLFERDARHVELTEAGAAIVERARRIVSQADALQDFAQQWADPLQGELRIGVIPTICPYLLPHIVKPLKNALPDLSIHWQETQSADCIELLAKGDMDAAVLALPYDIGRLQSAKLLTEKFCLLLPEGHALQEKAKVALADLDQETLLLLDEGHCLRDQALAVCSQTSVQQMPGFRATSLETLRQMVRSGMGCTLMPALALQADDITSEIKDFAASREVALVWRKSSARQVALKAVRQTIKAAVANIEAL